MNRKEDKMLNKKRLHQGRCIVEAFVEIYIYSGPIFWTVPFLKSNCEPMQNFRIKEQPLLGF